MSDYQFKKREIGTDIFSFFTNLCLIVIGFVIIFAPSFSLSFLIFTLLIAAVINGITLLIKGIFYPIEHRLIIVLGGFAYLGMSGLIIAYPQFSTFLLALLLGFWFFIDGFIKLIIANQYRQSQETNWWAMLLSSLTSFLFVVLFIFSTRFSTGLFLATIGVGLIFQGLSVILDNIFKGQSLSETKHRVKGGYFFLRAETLKAALFPRKLMNTYRSREKEDENFRKYLDKQNLVKTTEKSPVQIEVFIHSWENDPFMMGHTDFAIGDMVLSYGTYDGASIKFGGLISEGVLAVTTKQKYLKYAVEQEKKVLMGYTINLTAEQIAQIEPALQELFANTFDWYPPATTDPEANDAASQLYRLTGATFYKFKDRRYKYYFALNSNCVRMTEQFLNRLGIRDPHISGVLSPGDYLEFLESEINSTEETEFISRQIYSQVTLAETTPVQQ
ncbi:MAG: HdeD family acid-resistance protein [Culicoidibacterales bacterium]